MCFFDVFSTVHHSMELFHQPTLMHNFLHSLTICLLHYYPPHVSSINMPIFRRKNYIHTASDIFALCKRLHSTPVESGLRGGNFTNFVIHLLVSYKEIMWCYKPGVQLVCNQPTFRGLSNFFFIFSFNL